jgi:hypothetical protein
MRKRIFKLFWAWQDDQECKWLESMAEEGWILKNYHLLVYTFEKMEAKNYIYKTDFKSNQNRDLQEYITLFEDAGWEHVTQCVGWHYFRAEATKVKVTDIYTDNNSKIEMLKRLLTILIIPLIGILLIALTIVFNPTFSDHKLYIIIRIIYIFLILLLTYGVLKIIHKIKRLKG